jgi:rhodanese-related sulfurtransferase
MLLGDRIEPEDLFRLIGTSNCPAILDVRRERAFDESTVVLPKARRFVWTDAAQIGPCIVYCVHGHHVSQLFAADARSRGHGAAWLVGGIEGWKEAGLPVVAKEPDWAARRGGGEG